MPDFQNQTADGVTDTNLNQSITNSNIPHINTVPVTTVTAEPNSGSNFQKVRSALLGISILVISIAVSVRIVQQQQLQSVGAWDCSTYNFSVSKDGIVSVKNASTSIQPSQKVRVSINDEQKAIFEVPELSPGSASTIGSVEIPISRIFSWKASGIPSCVSDGSYDK